MTNSMTAFSSCSDEQSWGALVCEIRSVNHRYLDASFKLHEELRGLENTLRTKLTENIKRGKVECCLRYKPDKDQCVEVNINEANAKAVLKACQVISKILHQPSEMNVMEILRWPGVVNDQELDIKPVVEAASQLFEKALHALCETRKSEGGRLQTMIEERISAMKKIVNHERKRRPEVVKQHREKLLNRVEALGIEHDKNRFEQELAYLAQKMDIDEELDRIESHFVEIEKIFSSDEPVGRRLDFIMQEFNREANTLASKSTNIETTQASVDLKVLIEQMREQVQNIE